MPELPEVETVCRGLNELTLKQTITGGQVLLTRSFVHPFSLANFSIAIAGHQFIGWQRRGKYLLAAMADGAYLGVHLRMTGQLFWVDKDSAIAKHTRVRLFFGPKELRFVDVRTFGRMWWVPPKVPPEQVITGLQKLGPEPFAPEFSIEYLQQALSKRTQAIKTLLLDQGLVAGIGNIYADESLFKAGIHPTRLPSSLNSEEIIRLHRTVTEVLSAAIARGGTTFSDYLSLLGVKGNYGDIAMVYGRKEQPCRTCQYPIERIKLGGRSSHFCPICQPAK